MTTTLEDRSTRAKIRGVREQRRLASPLEMRTDAASGHIVLDGYAATFSPYEVLGGPANNGWIEQIDRRAFDLTLAGNPDVMLLVNHEGLPLAATKSGNLALSTDSHGLLIRAELDPSDPDVQRLAAKMRPRPGHRPLLDEMSFAFRVRNQNWSSDYTERGITEIDLRNGDVSVVNYGANPNTAAMMSTEAVGALAQLSAQDLVEIRAMDQQQVVRAMAVLRSAHQRAKTPKKYSEVSNFADPGYLDASGKPAKGGNGQKRYPLNSAARVRNALARFAQNKGRYSSEQQSAIMGKIRSAAKKFGIDVGEDSKAMSVDHFDMRYDAAGRAVWTAVMADGSSAPATFGAPTPAARAQGNAPNVGGPLKQTPPFTISGPVDPHEQDYGKQVMDPGLLGSGGQQPGADLGVPRLGGYDPHEQSYGPKQMLAMADDDMDDRDDMDECDDDDCDNPEHDHDEGRATSSAPGGKLGAGTEDHDEDEDDDQDDERDIDLGIAAALEATIVACYRMAGPNEDLRRLLGRARRQIAELRGNPVADGGDVSRRLAELRAEAGEPVETVTVSAGLRAIARAGFADMMKPAAG